MRRIRGDFRFYGFVRCFLFGGIVLRVFMFWMEKGFGRLFRGSSYFESFRGLEGFNLLIRRDLWWRGREKLVFIDNKCFLNFL